MNDTLAGTPSLSTRELRRMVYPRLAAAFVLLPLLLFVPAGTLRYWEAWVYLAILLIPGLLRDALPAQTTIPPSWSTGMRPHGPQAPQKLVIKLSFLWFFPGLHPAGVRSAVRLVGRADHHGAGRRSAGAAGLWRDLCTARENRYTQCVVEVADGSAGDSELRPLCHRPPPDVCRNTAHVPCDAGGAGIVVGVAPPLLVGADPDPRIVNEEKVLAENLPGYRAYMGKTRYRLIPGVW